MEIATIGLDIAKRVSQAHGADATGKVVLRRKLQRPEVLTFFAAMPPCLVGIEACSTAHHWAREITALGHQKTLNFVSQLGWGLPLSGPDLPTIRELEASERAFHPRRTYYFQDRW